MTRATVFGLDVDADLPLPFLQAAPAKPTGRTVEVSLASAGAELEWPATAAMVSDQRLPDGSVNFQFEADREAGYRIWGPEYGASLLSPDGKRLRGALGSGGLDAWQRLLIAQTLPFAAVIHGLEVFHVSAVVARGEAVAFAGHSGAGKTSLALELGRRGAQFLTDDVLALERVGDRLVGHPGTPVAGIAAEGDLARSAAEMAEVLAVNSRERIARVAVAEEPGQLSTLFLLDRRADGPDEPRFEPDADARTMISSTFNLVLDDGPRLERLLDVCALLAAGTVERVVYGIGVDVDSLGAAVEQRLGGLR